MENNMIEEQYKYGIYITHDEYLKYLEIIKNCKEVKNSIFNVGNVVKGNIITIEFKKEKNKILFDGSLNYTDGKISENRIINGIIYLDEMIVDMQINRLCILENSTYTTIDKFDKEVHETFYNHDLGFYKEEEKKK